MLCLLLVLTCWSARICLAADAPQPDTTYVVPAELSAIQVRAVMVGVEHLTKREDYNPEQRKLENYKVLIGEQAGLLKVSFVALRRPGDELVWGGNFTYAQSTSYLIDPANLEIKRVLASK